MFVAPGTVIRNRYEVRRLLGQGAYGEVYEVLDHHQGHVVALKLLNPQRVGPWPWQEATALTRLRSDYILPVWNADFVAGVPFLVTELATRGTLADAVGTTPMTPSDAVSRIRQASRGVARCHDDGVIHRDIKLENLFLGDGGRTLVGDFGLACPLDPSGTAPAGGTPATKAPEVLAGERTSKASDVYSLGACLYRLLTGIYPYTDMTQDVPALIAAAAAGPPTALRHLAPHVSRGLDRVIGKAMSRSPGDRYDSAGAFDAALGRLPPARRNWSRITPHRGHSACWTSDTTSGTALGVCVVPVGSRIDIVVTRSPSGYRILRHCSTGVARRLVPGRLRRIFEDLGN